MLPDDKRLIKFVDPADPTVRSSPMMSKFEFNAVIALRATQLSRGMLHLVDAPNLEIKTNMELRAIAIQELKEGKCPLIVKRSFPGGFAEYWKVSDLDLSNVTDLMR